MILIFKTPLRKRVEKLRSKLLAERLSIHIEKINRSINHGEYAKLFVRDGDLKDKIQMLDNLLNP